MNVSFEQVIEAFHLDHDADAGTNAYALRCLDMANAQFGKWTHGTLSKEELDQIVLPHHIFHEGELPGFELVPPEGSTVRQACKRLAEHPDFAAKHPICWQSIQRGITDPRPVFLASQPLAQNGVHSWLEVSGKLYHIDGLHRLIGRAMGGKPGSAYIAG